MMTEHFRAITDLYLSIDSIDALIQAMPESKDKYKLAVRAEDMRKAADVYSEDTLNMYDRMLSFILENKN